MASIIPGYEYDIFISYRQKDNKHDGWVTEFVDNLKGELEATFKEDISVYFDINPHDGLLETHSVNRSLEDKLKCLIFIPIISRTYCDPKSFAWEHEFVAFNKIAKEDRFGRDIKLTSGNVSSRILPIKIHDLDPEDKTILENELGGMLRSIEFIYKEAGVNRPLKPNDEVKENLNKTNYINQVNKVANAVKEIITALKKQSQQPVKVSKQDFEPKPIYQKNLRTTIIAGSILVLILFVLGFLFIPKLFKSKEQLEKSIAVLPFSNESPVDSNKYFINGIMEEVINDLQSIKDFRVLSRTSTDQYKGIDRPTIPEIARKLDVNYIIEGSGQKYGNTFILRVQLIKAKGKETHLWGKSYQQNILGTIDIFNIQSQIAESIASELKTTLTPQEKRLFEKPPTSNLDAYDAYLKGRYYYEKNEDKATMDAIKWFAESIGLDSAFTLPWTYLSMCYWRGSGGAGSPSFKKAKAYAEKGMELDPSSGVAIVNMAEILDNEYNFTEAEEKIKLALKIDPENPYVLRNAGRFYTLMGRGEESITFCKDAVQHDPNNISALSYLFDAYYYSNRFQEAKKVINELKDLGLLIQSRRYYRLLLAEDKLDSILNKPNYKMGDNFYKIALTAANFKAGNKLEAENLGNELIKDSLNYYYIAFAYSFSDNPDKVCELLEKSYYAKEKILTYLKVDPAFRKIRNEPRFKNIIKKMGFPD